MAREHHKRKHKRRRHKPKRSLWEKICYFFNAPFRNKMKDVYTSDPHAYYIRPNIFQKIWSWIWFLITTWVGWIIILICVIILDGFFHFL